MSFHRISIELNGFERRVHAAARAGAGHKWRRLRRIFRAQCSRYLHPRKECLFHFQNKNVQFTLMEPGPGGYNLASSEGVSHSEDSSMDRPGEKLRKIRERLKLTYRDVEKASQELARRRGSTEFLIPLSRLADIENAGKVPSLFRLYTLCVVYRLDFYEVLHWYGVPLEHLTADSLHVRLDETHPLPNKTNGSVTIPNPPGLDIDLSKTTFLSHLIRQWGKAPLSFLNGLDMKQH